MTDFVPPPPIPIPDLGASPMESERIEQEMRLEQRAHFEDVEEAVSETEAASTTLDLRLMQLGTRSVEVVAECADRSIRGRVTNVARDVATIETIGGARFCFHLDRVLAFKFIDSPGETRGVTTGHPATMIARLREMWNARERCTIGRVSGHAVLGDLQAVTESHVELADPQGNSWLIPMQTIAWIGPKD
ncbi:MAG: hypothetical protein KJN63_03805 [Acidimicrobiia bacterium]|nr:hypothetical protein [Acidimicrobiia bacterium]